MTPWSSQSVQPRGFRRFVRILALLLVIVSVSLLIERWRGQWALSHWKKQMAARGEVFEATALWPSASQTGVEFSNLMQDAISKLPPRMRNYSGQLASIVADAPGQFRRGSQEPRPRLWNRDDKATNTNTWEELSQLVQQSQPALQSLHGLMNNPPSSHGYDISKLLADNTWPNFVGVRMSAQALQAVALNNLHRGDLNAAEQDLEALLSYGRLYEQDPDLLNLMIRVAVMGMTVDVCWDALQAEGWTEPQLAALQRACVPSDRVLEQMPRALQAIRIENTHHLAWLRSHPYPSLIARARPLYEAFGSKLPDSSTGFSGFTRQWLFLPVWKFAWADQNELERSQQSQKELTILREGIRQQSWTKLDPKTKSLRESYRPPIAAWRFYAQLPLFEELVDVETGHVTKEIFYPGPDFSRAWETTMKNLTLHELMTTAIALKRYDLKHGKPPADLAALVPEFLPALPIDLMNGQPLHYRLNPDNSFALYSVGNDGRDDGGTFKPETSSNSPWRLSPWNQRDWVWPRAAASRGSAF